MYKLAFFIIRLFRKIIENTGADYNQVQAIVRLKLTMDNRKPIGLADNKKERNSAVWYQVFLYQLFGIMFALIIGTHDSVSTSMLITFSFLMMFSSINMIAEFSTLLLDTRDNTIILPRPVQEKTLLIARFFHIATYIFVICSSFSILPLIVTSVKFNLAAGFVFFIEVMLSALFSIFITHVFYLSLMKYTSGERFKDIIAYFQTIMSIIFMGGYQLLPRLVDKIQLGSPSGLKIFFIPPAWMKGAVEIFATFQFSLSNFILFILSIVVPLTGIWVVIKYLAPGYARKLVELEQGDLTKSKKDVHRKKLSIASVLAKIFTGTTTENSTFQAAWKITGRDRLYKQTVFALLGSLLIMTFILAFRDVHGLKELKNTYKYLFIIYPQFHFLFYLVISAKYSANFQTSWVYLSTPVKNPGEIIAGLYKSLIIKFYLPAFVICNSFSVFIWGLTIVPVLVFGFFFNILFVLILFFIFPSDLPFSVEKKAGNAGSNIALSLLSVIMAFALGGLHYFFISLHWNSFFLLLVAISGCWLMFYLLRIRGWNRIEPVKI